MKIYISQLLLKLLFAIGISVFFIQCGSDDPVREAATESALKSTSEKKATRAPLPAEPVQPTLVGNIPISASSVTASKGSEVCISVTARQFNKIVSMQYTMKFDPKVLKFKEIKNFGLPGMGAQSFGARAAHLGILSYSWFDANVQGVTKPDGFKLYDVCFEAIGKAGSKSAFEFADRPVVIEITDAASQFYGIQQTNGSVTVR